MKNKFVRYTATAILLTAALLVLGSVAYMVHLVFTAQVVSDMRGATHYYEAEEESTSPYEECQSPRQQQYMRDWYKNNPDR